MHRAARKAAEAGIDDQDGNDEEGEMVGMRGGGNNTTYGATEGGYDGYGGGYGDDGYGGGYGKGDDGYGGGYSSGGKGDGGYGYGSYSKGDGGYSSGGGGKGDDAYGGGYGGGHGGRGTRSSCCCCCGCRLLHLTATFPFQEAMVVTAGTTTE